MQIESSLAQSTCGIDAIKVDLSRADPNCECSVDRSLETKYKYVLKQKLAAAGCSALFR